jgi:hypothetical protein
MIDLVCSVSILRRQVDGDMYFQKSADRMIRIPKSRKDASSRTSCDDGYERPFPPVLERRAACWEGFNPEEKRFHEPFSHHDYRAASMADKQDWITTGRLSQGE